MRLIDSDALERMGYMLVRTYQQDKETMVYEMKKLSDVPSAQPEVLACGSGELVQESDGLVKDLVKDCISRKMAIDAVEKKIRYTDHDEPVVDWNDFVAALCFLPSAQPEHTMRFADADHVWVDGKQYISLRRFQEAVVEAQPDRDIPMKPLETTDKAWGIPCRQAVCPKCDYYLGHVAFLGDYKGKRVTYCETCGQAIDWEGWEFDE